MRFAHTFIDRPIFATVISVLTVLIGAIAFEALPVAQYPEVAPPTIVVSAQYPGASAEVVADTVATPLEQEINGVENMLYMVSQSTGDGRISITVTFKLGTDLDAAQVLVQNRVAIAEPSLPEEVRRLGVTTAKNSPDLMMVIHLASPDGSLDQLYVSNYAILQIRDVLARLDGVGEVRVFGAREYAMRLWLDPERMAQVNLVPADVVAAVRAQNVQVAAGALGQAPITSPSAFQLNVTTLGRLSEPKQFEQIVVKSGEDGRVTRIRDIARVELAAEDYITNSYLDGQNAVAILIFQRPGSNALATADRLQSTMQTLAANFPDGLAYRIVYNPTEYIAQSVDAVIQTIFEAVALVILVIIVFLQSWRAAVIPIVAIPVSLIGTFAVMAAFGYSLNTLSLFGLVLAVGIVVDDAIVVVENVERNLHLGLPPREATRRSMDEVGGALIATSLVLLAVFIPTAFIPGISGQFYRQFAVTIAASTAISTLVSLTLSPALASLLLRRQPTAATHSNGKPARRGPLYWPLWPFRQFFRGFNWVFDRMARGYGNLTRRLIRIAAIPLIVYAGLVALGFWQFDRTPAGFIPQQDQGYFILAIQLPPGSSLSRTDAVVREASERLLAIDGIDHAVAFAGFNGATFTNAPNTGAIFATTESFETLKEKNLPTAALLNQMRAAVGQIQDAFILVIQPPPVRGIGTGGGFKMYVQDRGGHGLRGLEEATGALAGAANQAPGLVAVFSMFNTRTPIVYADIDRVRAEKLGVRTESLFDTLETYLGSTYVNDFNLLGRTFRVTALADGPYRDDPRDILRLKVRNTNGDMVPIGSVARLRDDTTAYRVPRYNLYPAAELQGATLPGFSTGDAITTMERLAAETLPDGIAYEWTELAYQEKQAGGSALLVFAAAVVFVFLVLAAQYESWLLPLAVILIVPLCLLAAITGVVLRGLPNDILVQIGLVVLVALAAKNAILIVEFAKQAEAEGRTRLQAAVEAAHVRLRPILMTSFAFILGVLPLVLAEGAGAEMRQSLGTAVFSGMIGVTFFGLMFTPIFYVVCRKMAIMDRQRSEQATSPADHSSSTV